MLSKEQVKEARKRLGMSQTEFGDAVAGVSGDHVSRIESGKAPVPGWMENAVIGLVMRLNGFSFDIKAIRARTHID